jgi:hypothetical protein
MHRVVCWQRIAAVDQTLGDSISRQRFMKRTAQNQTYPQSLQDNAEAHNPPSKDSLHKSIALRIQSTKSAK